MAELNPTAYAGTRRQPTPPRVDLTPMVDLGFLLITFFMFTASLSRPKLLEMQVPDQRPLPNGPQIPGESTLILIPAADNKIAFYNGLQSPGESLAWCSFKGAQELRALLQRERSRVHHLPATFSAAAHKLHVLIKPDTSANFDDVVQVLDEMSISDVPYFTLMRISQEEQEALKSFPKSAYGM